MEIPLSWILIIAGFFLFVFLAGGGMMFSAWQHRYERAAWLSALLIILPTVFIVYAVRALFQNFGIEVTVDCVGLGFVAALIFFVIYGAAYRHRFD